MLSGKINLNFYFHTPLWCLRRFCEGLKGYHKSFWGTTKKCENKNSNTAETWLKKDFVKETISKVGCSYT